MKKVLVLAVASSLILGSTALAQECSKSKASSCDSAKLSASVAKLTKAADQGCETSKATLASLQKSCGTSCPKSLATKVAKLESWAADGCKESQATLASMNKKASGKKACSIEVSLSQRIYQLSGYCDEGCKPSNKAIAALKEACGTECSKELLADVIELEKSAAGGCDASTAELKELGTVLKANMKKLPPTLAQELSGLDNLAQKGCETSRAKLASYKQLMGTECSQELTSKIAKLEAWAAHGCEDSQAKLAKITKKMKGKAKKASLSNKISQMSDWAGKGCESSCETLASLKKACGTECPQELQKKVATLEKYASQGCDESKAKLAKLQKLVAKK